MPSGNKNREIQGFTQVRRITKESIVDFEIVASKLNSNVAGNGITLDPVTNAISIIGATVVQDTAGLSNALTSGSMAIHLLDGNYTLPQITVSSGTLRLFGSSKDGTVISLPPSGTISVNHKSGQILTGFAAIDTTINRGVAYVSGMVSGQMPQFSWIGSQLVLDDIPYLVNRIVSGESSGIAQVELVEPYTGSSFASKPFKLMYMIDGFVLSDLTVVSASDSGVVDIQRAKGALINNVTIKGANVLLRITSGLRLKETYLSSFHNVDILNTNWTSSFAQDRYAAEIDTTFYSAFENLKIRNAISNGLLINASEYLTFNDIKYANLNGSAFNISNSDEIEISQAHLTRTGLPSTINNSTNISFSDSFVENDTLLRIISVTNSTAKVSDNTFYNSQIAIAGSGNVVVGDNNFNGDLTTDAIFVFSGEALINGNTFANTQSAANIASSVVRFINNSINNCTSGVFMDSGTGSSIIDNNQFFCFTDAITVLGTGNSISNNTILSGLSTIVLGNFNVRIRPFIFTQSVPATTWAVNHQLGSTKYTYSIFDLATGDAYIPDAIFAVDSNNIQVDHAFPSTGTLVLVFVS